MEGSSLYIIGRAQKQIVHVNRGRKKWVEMWTSQLKLVVHTLAHPLSCGMNLGARRMAVTMS